METELLTAEQARAILQISLSTFYREVRQGIYPTVKKGKRMLFPRAAIEAHARIHAPEDTLTFARATNADIWQRIENNTAIYGAENMISYQRALQWREANPDISMSIYDAGRMVGGVTIMPIDEPYILAFCREEIQEKDIPLTAIRKWTDPGLSAYVATIAIVRSGSQKKDAIAAAYLIKNTIRWAISLHLQHDIKQWYAVGFTPEGQALSEALGFQEFLSLASDHKAYKLDSIQGSALLRRFTRKIDNGEVLL